VLADHDEVAALERSGLHEHGGDRTAALVHVRFDDPADRRAIRVRLEVGHVGHEQDDIDEVLQPLLRARGHGRERRVAAVLLDRDAVLRELPLHVVRVRVRFVDLVERHDHRHTGRADVRDRFDRLRLHAIVGRDDEDRHVGDLRAAGTHGGERFVTGSVEERDLPARVLDLICADVLGDAARFARRDVRLADRVEQTRLAVVHVSHDRDHRRARDHLGRIVVGPEDLLAARRLFLGLVDHRGDLFLRNDLEPELTCDERRGLVVDRLVDRRHDAHVDERADDVDDREVERVRELADLHRLRKRDRHPACGEDGDRDRRGRDRRLWRRVSA